MKILLADPHPEVQSALHLVIDRLPEVTLVSETSSLAQLLAHCARACPDLILFDLDLVHPSRSHSQSVASLISELRCLCPGARVVAMSSRFEGQQEALAAGANGFISKTDPPDTVLSGILQYLEKRL
jgi:two-component system, NarL family, invasion response regulator UvrY